MVLTETNIQRVAGIETYGAINPTDCNDFQFGIVSTPVKGTNSDQYATEHILEFQLISIFLEEAMAALGEIYSDLTPGAIAGSKVDLCKYMKPFWNIGGTFWFSMDNSGAIKNPLDWIGSVYPGKDNAWVSEFVLLETGVNTAKEGVRTTPSLSSVRATN